MECYSYTYCRMRMWYVMNSASSMCSVVKRRCYIFNLLVHCLSTVNFIHNAKTILSNWKIKSAHDWLWILSFWVLNSETQVPESLLSMLFTRINPGTWCNINLRRTLRVRHEEIKKGGCTARCFHITWNTLVIITITFTLCSGFGIIYFLRRRCHWQNWFFEI